MRHITTVAWCLLLGACSSTAPLQGPEPQLPGSFPGQSRLSINDACCVRATEIGWRRMFGDPALQRLIDIALANNRDLRLATLNVEAVQSQYRIQRARQLPAVAADVTGTRERAKVDKGTKDDASSVSQTAGINVGVSAFELDLFGRVKALSDAALARYLASEQGQKAAQITLIATVADAYYAQRLAKEQLQLAVQTQLDWQQSLVLARLLKDASQNSGLDVALAEGQVAVAEADVHARQRSLKQADNALQLLLGTASPANLPPPLPLDQQPVLTRLPVGLPSDLLLQRPDLMQAEQLLVAAHADIGAARAAFYPSITLTASFGVASSSLSGLFDAGSRVWRFAPQITQPLFQVGRLQGELRLAELRKSEALAQFERSIQIAFREVADALAGSATYADQLAAQSRAVASAERRVLLTAQRYRAGLDGRLELLEAQRQHHNARQTLLELRRNEISNAVALYKALGGGLHRDVVQNPSKCVIKIAK